MNTAMLLVLTFVMLMCFVLMATTTAVAVTSLPESIEEQNDEESNPNPVHRAQIVSAGCVSNGALDSKPVLRKQVVDA